MTRTTLFVLLVGIATPLLQGVHGFLPASTVSTTLPASRHCHQPQAATTRNHDENDSNTNNWIKAMERTLQTTSVAAIVALSLTTSAWAADSSSFVNKDISGMDFSGKDLAGQDFTGVVARKTNFHNSNLQGSTFNKAILENTDFSGANVRKANFLDATLDGASFKDAVAERAIFSATILDIGDLEGVDLTDSLWPSK